MTKQRLELWAVLLIIAAGYGLVVLLWHVGAPLNLALAAGCFAVAGLAGVSWLGVVLWELGWRLWTDPEAARPRAARSICRPGGRARSPRRPGTGTTGAGREADHDRPARR